MKSLRKRWRMRTRRGNIDEDRFALAESSTKAFLHFARRRKVWPKGAYVWEGLKLSFVLARGEIARDDLGEFSRGVSLLSRRVMDRLEEGNPAFQKALRKALAEESLPLSVDELRALILDRN